MIKIYKEKLQHTIAQLKKNNPYIHRPNFLSIYNRAINDCLRVISNAAEAEDSAEYDEIIRTLIDYSRSNQDERGAEAYNEICNCVGIVDMLSKGNNLFPFPRRCTYHNNKSGLMRGVLDNEPLNSDSGNKDVLEIQTDN